ncbi:Bug family tripartite tricarboxylate transporter substrate binding protein [Variovorax boronicumulans]|uniref:Bug family tripartite tricarboxylate transporter substrate binding protein n=1 Tax=Variovorax boronicumulans TaxID=436515 RepID=UPI00214AE46B
MTMILPFGPGGSVDVLARALGVAMAEELNVPVVMDNRPGASGAIGAAAAARAAADGTTLFFGSSSTQSVLPNVRAKLPFDPVSDFTPISLVAEVENALVVNPAVPAQSLGELVAYAKANPGKLSYGSFGTGSITHLAAELFKMAAGVDIVHVPYKTATDLDVALMGGQLHCAFVTLASSMPHIKSGRLRPLAVSSSQRSPFLPQVPTTAEAGYPAVIAVSWGALYAPRRMDPALVTRLNAVVRKALEQPQVKERFHAVNARPLPSSPQELAAYQARDHARWANVVKTARIEVEG